MRTARKKLEMSLDGTDRGAVRLAERQDAPLSVLPPEYWSVLVLLRL